MHLQMKHEVITWVVCNAHCGRNGLQYLTRDLEYGPLSEAMVLYTWDEAVAYCVKNEEPIMLRNGQPQLGY